MTNEELRQRIAGLGLHDRSRMERDLDRRGLSAGLEASVARAEDWVRLRQAAVPEVTYPEDLPVSGRRDDILAALAANQVVVVAGETGSGKTTQIPKMCLELGRGVKGMIGHTQPRRIAARTVAERLADELGVDLGGAVGYSVRFTDTVSDRTLVRVMTDGLLLAEIRNDRLLQRYDTIIVDEAHERSLNIDFLLGYLTALLPRRPDLKVVVTSATIDTDRFARHFGAPVIEVTGRNYQVEVRYRPPGDDEDLPSALSDAVGALVAETAGDVLVFLPGERDIRDAADSLRHFGPEGIEILPLYARLSAAEQHRVFKPHRGRRVVLATNVAETSLTVPGIRSVVDTGLARISRYSHRTKVQRLRIEAISQASADQRAGRCGRVAPGVCVRLYAEEDFDGRPRYTDPEILRTNLASVILQMAALGLGEIEDFPFIEPPDRRSVADGRRLLEELGALVAEEGRYRITRLGRRLARLPLDPRLGRMVLEAERLRCLREVTVIAAALSVQDPRERPAERAEEAAAMHRRFDVPGSDFLAMVRLWDHVAELQAELSGNQFRKRCRAEFLNVLRLREWQDVAGQIRQAYRCEGISANAEPAPPAEVHRALLSGLLSQIGMRDRSRGDYQGARGTRWLISRNSAQNRRQPAWAMAGELVETERTWARNIAAIEPSWAERAGAHLVKRTLSDPWWDPQRAEAFVDERVTLYGLPLCERRVPLARTDAAAARSMFISRALVDGDWDEEPAALAKVRARSASIDALEDRVRRRGLRATGDALYGWFDQHLPSDVHGGRRFKRWSRGSAGREALDVPLEVLLSPAARGIRLSDYPDEIDAGEVRLPLAYRFAPGEPDDGVTAQVGLAAVERLDPGRLAWGIPGHRLELMTAMVRLLPKPVRRQLGPAPEAAAAVLAGCGPQDGPLWSVAAARLSTLAGTSIEPSVWDPAILPDHLRMRFEVFHPDGRLLAAGRDLLRVRSEVLPALRAAIAALAPDIERHGATTWDFGDLPRRVERNGFVGYPALVDEGRAVGVAVLSSPAGQAASNWSGIRRLLVLNIPLPTAHIARRLGNSAAAAAAAGVSVGALIADCAEAVADDLIVAAGGPTATEAAYAELEATARATMADRVVRVARIAAGVIAAADSVRFALVRMEAAQRWDAAVTDVRRQVDRLVQPGFVAATGTTRLGDVLRYLKAAGRRLEKLPGDTRRDAERQAVVRRLEERYESLLDSAVSTAATGPGLAEIRWMIEELRVSLWAQELGTRGTASPERISRALSALGA